MTHPFTDQKVLEGKVALVAGASSGINLQIATRFHQAGAKVAILSRSHEKITAAAAGIAPDVLAFAVDVRDFDGVAAAYQKTVDTFGGPIDVVLSGAAGNFLSPAAAMSSNAFKTVIDIDLIGTFNVLRASWDHLRKPGASLISITAPQGERGMMFQAHACAAKAGINRLTECLAMEWGPAGVRVNAVSPGPIGDTEGMRRLGGDPAMEKRIKGSIALRDYGTKDDVADMALFLATDAARYITGAILDVDGGSRLGDASADALPPPRRD